mmetsp:Transcript_13899/g.38198  ORF Transcript_13899/g.38198 Transcript_13899/m.38198 type:complete len:228 (-) Transcript_13899:683-1366(-)
MLNLMLELLNLPVQLVHNHDDEWEQRKDQESQPGVVLLGASSCSNSGERLWIFRHRDQTHDESHWQRDGTESHRALPFFPRQRRCLREVSSELDDRPLCDDGEEDHHEEHRGTVQGSHWVESIANFTGVEFVEHLAEDKGVEDDGEMVGGPVLAIVHHWTFVEEEDEQGELVCGLDEDVTPHRAADQTGVTAVWSAVQKFQSWWFRSESKGTHGVHDQIHPKHHDCV